MRTNGHAFEIRASTAAEDIKPIVVTKFERVGGADFDSVEGFFTRNSYFLFQACMSDRPDEDTYPGTRIAEIYIRCQGDNFSQWQWHSHDRQELNWEFGEHLLADFRAGIEPAIRSRIPDTKQYCADRIDTLVKQFIETGIDPSAVAAALRASLKRLTPNRSNPPRDTGHQPP